MIQATNYDGNQDYNVLTDEDVVDNLTSTSTTAPLSANQGKQLKTLIDGIEVGTDPSVTADISQLKTQMKTANSNISNLQSSDSSQDSEIATIKAKLQKGIFFKQGDIMLQMENYQGTTNYNLLEYKDIVNNLTTSATNKALSANQGKVLNDKIEKMNNFFEYNQNQEIDTGLKWVNGKPIYRRYCKIDLSNVSLKGTYDFDATQCDYVFIDECSCLWSTQSYSSGASFYFYPVNYSYETTTAACSVNKSTVNVDLSSSFEGWYNIFYVVLLYVKKG